MLFYCGSSTAAAAGGRTSCRTSQNLPPIGALLYDPVIKLLLNQSKYLKSQTQNKYNVNLNTTYLKVLKSVFFWENLMKAQGAFVIPNQRLETIDH